MPWLYGLAVKDNDIREIEVFSDGLMMRSKFETVADLLKERPQHGKILTVVWYFNQTRDREIAEIERGTQTVEFNPQLLWQAGFEITT